MSTHNYYGGQITLTGGDDVLFNSSAIAGGVNAIGIRVTNTSTTDDIFVYVRQIHRVLKLGEGTPDSYGQVVGPGKTVEYWMSGGGSRPGSGMIDYVLVKGTVAATVNWSVIAK